MQRLFVSILLLAISAIRLLGQQTMPLGPYGKLPVVIGNTSTATATLTPGQMTTVHINNNAGAATLTTPTATLLCRLFPFVRSSGNAAGTVNFAWDWYVVNNGTMTVTLAGGSGVSVTSGYTGTLTIAAASVKHFMVVLTNCGATPAAALLSLGTSVF
jgi:oxalate decarboxylase/phosphoglucose isomerase-like protein (cupin superfamily)